MSEKNDNCFGCMAIFGFMSIYVLQFVLFGLSVNSSYEKRDLSLTFSIISFVVTMNNHYQALRLFPPF